MISRRQFLKAGAGQLILTTTPIRQAVSKEGTEYRPLAICQLATNDRETLIRVIHDNKDSLTYKVGDDSGQAQIRLITTETGEGPLALTLIWIDNLQLGRKYQLQAFHNQALIDQRQFQALDPYRTDYRFALGSCMNDLVIDHQIWQQMEKASPDFIVFNGDTVYADNDRGENEKETLPSTLFRRFCQALADLPYSHWPKLIPVFATWDDHDFGKNNSGADYKYKKESKVQFHKFFASNIGDSKFVDYGPGVCKRVNIGDCAFMMMDSRTFRLGRKKDGDYATWGRTQQEWLLDNLNQHSGPAWIINGTQLFPGTRWSESMSYDHKKQFKKLLKDLKSSSSRCLFVSGDVHFSEVSKIDAKELGYESREITASSIHSAAIPGMHFLFGNPRRIVGASRYNFVIVESSTASGDLRIHIEAIGKSGSRLFQNDFSLSL